MRGRLAVGQLHQHVLRRAPGQRQAHLRKMRHHQVQAESRHQFESRQRRTASLLRQRQQLQRLLRRVECNQRGQFGGRLREQFHHCSRDDAQRAFRADVQIAQVVAGIVLAQAAQAIPDRAVRGHDFEAEAQLACIPVAQDGRAAGIGRQIAADAARPFGGERERKQAACGACGLLHMLEDATGFERDRIVDRVQRADAVQAGERQDDCAAAAIGYAAQHEAGIAALRHDRHLVLVAQANDGSDFGGRAGFHDRPRDAGKASAPVGQMGRHVRAIGEHVGRTDGALAC